MRAPKERFDFIQEFLKRVFDGDLHAKRILSLANGTLGVMTGAALAVSLVAKSAIKQVDRLLSNAGVAPWDLFGSWIAEIVGERREIVVAMDWTDFDSDNQCTLALHLVTSHGRATPLLWLTVDKDELKDQRNDFEDLCLARLGSDSAESGHRPKGWFGTKNGPRHDGRVARYDFGLSYWHHL